MDKAVLVDKRKVPAREVDGVELLGRALHRTRNLMMSIRGYAELIECEETDLQQSRVWAAKIVQQIDRLEELQGRVDVANAGRGESGVHSLAMIARVAIERSRSRSEERVPVQLELLGDALVVGDGDDLVEAVAALIDNAREASPDGASEVVVRVACDERDSWSLQVIDQGSGMGADTLERLGQPFFTRKSGHVGLGIFLSRTLLQRHGLTLEFATSGDSGTVATIRERRRPSGGIR